jgi:hypothetical protein
MSHHLLSRTQLLLNDLFHVENAGLSSICAPVDEDFQTKSNGCGGPTPLLVLKATVPGAYYRLATIADAELFENFGDVILDRFLADEQSLGDFRIINTFRDLR